jgi:hypothetical protein
MKIKNILLAALLTITAFLVVISCKKSSVNNTGKGTTGSTGTTNSDTTSKTCHALQNLKLLVQHSREKNSCRNTQP